MKIPVTPLLHTLAQNVAIAIIETSVAEGFRTSDWRNDPGASHWCSRCEFKSNLVSSPFVRVWSTSSVLIVIGLPQALPSFIANHNAGPRRIREMFLSTA